MRITIVHPPDAHQIIELQKSCYLQEAQQYDNVFIELLIESEETLIADMKDSIVLKLIEKGNVIGSVRAKQIGTDCFVSKLFIHPEYQHVGLEMQLLLYLEAQFNEAQRFEFLTNQRNEENQELYTKLGYREFKRETENNKLTVVFWEKYYEVFA